MRGRFITFEGIEGAGKSTQMGLLRAWMEGEGLPVLTTFEPGGTELGGGIRALLLSPREEGVAPLAELMLYEADRAEHVSRVIRPALEAGVHVLCDRFTDSTLAYQAFGRGLPEEKVRELNAWAAGGFAPDLTLLFLPSAEEGLRRAKGGRAGDRLEEEGIGFHERVRLGFLELARREPGRIRLLPEGSVEEVHRKILQLMADAFGWAGRASGAKTQR